MIFDQLSNIQFYSGLSERISKAIEFIKSTDLAALPTGKQVIDGKEIYAAVSEYEPKSIENCKPEAHKNYIDIQMVVSGSERIGYLPLTDQQPSVAYNEEKDVMFFKENCDTIALKPGMFAMFFPQDIHQPCISDGFSENVKKIVVKILI